MSRQLPLFPELEPEPSNRAGNPPSKERQPSARTTSQTVASDFQCQSSFRVAASAAVTPEPEPVEQPVESLRRKLRSWLKEPLGSLVLTNNRRRIISARPAARGLAVRIHRSFLEADDETLRAVTIFLNSRKGEMQRTIALQVIRSYFDRHRSVDEPPSRRLRLQPKGRHVDLRDLRDRLNQQYFAGALRVLITWGKAPTVRRRRGRGFSILLGSYTETDRLVRIHPCLDQAHVPEHVVESVVYHEMLHAALPSEHHNGRRRLHTPEFRRREKLYRHAAAANQWLEDNLSRLAASR